MKWRSLGLSIILLGTILLREAALRLAPSGPDPSLLAMAATANDAESCFAKGGTFPLACADMIDVELLPGISDRLAAELLASRQDVSEAAQFMTSSEALQKVRGIGPSLGATLSAYLSTEESCPES
jgi:hypothetical protein